MTKFQNMKIRIKDAEHSRQVQECLFKLGYKWAFGAKVTVFTPLYVYAYEDGRAAQDSEYDANSYFEKHSSKETTLEDLQAMLAEQSTDVGKEPEIDAHVNFTPEQTISTYIKQLQQLLKDSRTAIYIYENEIRICNMCNDDEAIVQSWDEVAEVLKIKQQYLSKFKGE